MVEKVVDNSKLVTQSLNFGGKMAETKESRPYIKLDWEWRNDPKVIEFEMRYGKASLVDLIDFFTCLSRMGGSFNLDDKTQVVLARRNMGNKSEKWLKGFVHKLYECELIRKDAYEMLNLVGSNRSISDAEKRSKRRQYAVEASAAAAKKRKLEADEKECDTTS